MPSHESHLFQDNLTMKGKMIKDEDKLALIGVLGISIDSAKPHIK